jgi:hypothetical protein
MIGALNSENARETRNKNYNQRKIKNIYKNNVHHWSTKPLKNHFHKIIIQVRT